jgi:hypothetical protein
MELPAQEIICELNRNNLYAVFERYVDGRACFRSDEIRYKIRKVKLIFVC